MLAAAMADMGNPSRAYRSARPASSEKGRVPNRSSKVNHPSTAPGTVTVSGPKVGIRSEEIPERTASRVAAAGARPDPL